MSPEQRELLELAAKALGVNGAWDHYKGQFRLYVEGQRTFLGDAWSPIDNDGDCARMEAALLMRVVFNRGWVSVGHELFGAEEQCEFYSPHGGDRNAARRLASTYVAASIGRSMP